MLKEKYQHRVYRRSEAWSVINTGFPSETFSKIYFKDHTNGFIFKHTPGIFATANPGLNRVERTVESTQLTKAIFFSDSNTGYISCSQEYIFIL